MRLYIPLKKYVILFLCPVIFLLFNFYFYNSEGLSFYARGQYVVFISYVISIILINSIIVYVVNIPEGNLRLSLYSVLIPLSSSSLPALALYIYIFFADGKRMPIDLSFPFFIAIAAYISNGSIAFSVCLILILGFCRKRTQQELQ